MKKMRLRTRPYFHDLTWEQDIGISPIACGGDAVSDHNTGSIDHIAPRMDRDGVGWRDPGCPLATNQMSSGCTCSDDGSDGWWGSSRDVCPVWARRTAEERDRLLRVAAKVNEWVEDEGWCPVCDEHHCRPEVCELAAALRDYPKGGA